MESWSNAVVIRSTNGVINGISERMFLIEVVISKSVLLRAPLTEEPTRATSQLPSLIFAATPLAVTTGMKNITRATVLPRNFALSRLAIIKLNISIAGMYTSLGSVLLMLFIKPRLVVAIFL